MKDSEREHTDTEHTSLVTRTLEGLDDLQKWQLAGFLQQLLIIRNSSLPAAKKLKDVIKHTKNAKPILTVLHRSVDQLKDVAWDDRTWASRLGLSTAVVASVATAGQGAGIALLGTAIGVPLWVVFGAGGAFAGAIVEEIKRSLPTDIPAASSGPAPLDVIGDSDYELLSTELELASTRLLAAAEAVQDEAGAAPIADRDYVPPVADAVTAPEADTKIARAFFAIRERGEAIIDKLQRDEPDDVAGTSVFVRVEPALGQSLTVRVGLDPENPTLQHGSDHPTRQEDEVIALSKDDRDRLARRIRRLEISPVRHSPEGLDGVSYEVSFHTGGNSAVFHWWVHAPSEWKDLEEFVADVCELVGWNGGD